MTWKTLHKLPGSSLETNFCPVTGDQTGRKPTGETKMATKFRFEIPVTLSVEVEAVDETAAGKLAEKRASDIVDTSVVYESFADGSVGITRK
jgi:hypothetical protein